MNNFTDNRSKQYITNKLFIFIILAMTVFMLAGCFTSGRKAEDVQHEMTVYLKEKYGLDFAVGKPYITGSMNTRHYKAKAHPQGQAQPEFMVNGDNYNTGFAGNYEDDYLKVKWSYQGKQEVEKKIREVYGEGVDFNISRYEFGVKDAYAFKDLDYAQVFIKSQGNGVIHLNYDVFMDGDQFNKQTETKKAYQILKSFALDFGSNSYRFSVTYIDKAFKQDYLSNSREYIVLDKAYQDKKLANFLRADSISSEPIVIDSDSDLIKFYKY